ncbi:hypothetical protein [Kordia sp.]|uniref:hypothetical protein n=1 Tax=Kordia sp. TaxID=1965332 RepID=UPI003D299B98
MDIIYYIIFYSWYLLYGVIIFIILKYIFSKALKDHHSNWNTLIDGFQYSPTEFYERLTVELKSHGITNITMRKKSLKEGGMLSFSRLYLRVTWKDYQYDICGAKFGNGFFISWWLLYKNSFGKLVVSKIPFAGAWLAEKLYPVTYYRIDTASMFMSYAQSSVLKVLDDITKDKGVRSLNEAERKPLLNNVFTR